MGGCCGDIYTEWLKALSKLQLDSIKPQGIGKERRFYCPLHFPRIGIPSYFCQVQLIGAGKRRQECGGLSGPHYQRQWTSARNLSSVAAGLPEHVGHHANAAVLSYHAQHCNCGGNCCDWCVWFWYLTSKVFISLRFNRLWWELQWYTVGIIATNNFGLTKLHNLTDILELL